LFKLSLLSGVVFGVCVSFSEIQRLHKYLHFLRENFIFEYIWLILLYKQVVFQKYWILSSFLCFALSIWIYFKLCRKIFGVVFHMLRTVKSLQLIMACHKLLLDLEKVRDFQGFPLAFIFTVFLNVTKAVSQMCIFSFLFGFSTSLERIYQRRMIPYHRLTLHRNWLWLMRYEWLQIISICCFFVLHSRINRQYGILVEHVLKCKIFSARRGLRLFLV
jgi:hypothetical protein